MQIEIVVISAIINLTEPGITWEKVFWTCPWVTILIKLIEMGGTAHSNGDHSYSSGPGLRKREERAEH